MQEINLIVPSGIGDISWVYSKVSTLKMPINFYITDIGPSRAIPFLKLLDHTNHCEVTSARTKEVLQFGDKYDYTVERVLEESKDKSLYFQINTHLENGNRIETYVPDMAIDYNYNINLPMEDVKKAEELVHPFKRYVTFYCSSLRTSGAWKGWQEKEWCAMGEMLVREYDLDGIVIIGAEWDKDLAEKIENYVGNKFAIKNLVGQLPIGGSLSVIWHGLYFIGFPSGMPILATIIDSPVYMFYPEHLEKMQYAWVKPELINNKRYKASEFCNPVDVFDWIYHNVNDLFE